MGKINSKQDINSDQGCFLIINIHSNFNISNSYSSFSSFTMAVSNLFSRPREILQIAQENKYLGIF